MNNRIETIRNLLVLLFIGLTCFSCNPKKEEIDPNEALSETQIRQLLDNNERLNAEATLEIDGVMSMIDFSWFIKANQQGISLQGGNFDFDHYIRSVVLTHMPTLPLKAGSYSYTELNSRITVEIENFPDKISHSYNNLVNPTDDFNNYIYDGTIEISYTRSLISIDIEFMASLIESVIEGTPQNMTILSSELAETNSIPVKISMDVPIYERYFNE